MNHSNKNCSSEKINRHVGDYEIDRKRLLLAAFYPSNCVAVFFTVGKLIDLQMSILSLKYLFYTFTLYFWAVFFTSWARFSRVIFSPYFMSGLFLDPEPNQLSSSSASCISQMAFITTDRFHAELPSFVRAKIRNMTLCRFEETFASRPGFRKHLS